MDERDSQDLIDPIGHYEPVMRLGQGGAAYVYLAVAKGRKGFSKPVVLKMLRPQLARDAYARQAFLDEARLAARLNHRHIVQTIEVAQEPERDAIVMEYLEGRCLHEILKRPLLPEDDGQAVPLGMHLQIIADVLIGLHYAHDLVDFDRTPLRIVHRDVSPQNVFVTYDGIVKILDFGIAKASMTSSDTATGIIKGKIRYLSPEQVLYSRGLDRRTDIFSAGIMLWEAATGARFWAGVTDSEIARRLTDGRIRSPRKVKPDLDEELEQVIMKALAVDRDERYPTAEALRIALEPVMKRLGAPLESRELGRFVATHFAQAREETKRTIDERLLVAAAQRTSKIPVAGPQSTSQDSAIALSAFRSRRRATLLTAVLACMIVLVLAGIWAHSRMAWHNALARPSPSVADSAQVDQVTLQVSVSPSWARIYIDSQPYRSPVHARFTPDDAHHVVRAEADGHETMSRTVSFRTSARIDLVLDPLPVPPAPAVRPSATSRPVQLRRWTPAAKGTTGNLCKNPFYIDNDRGIKTIRPECR